MAGYHQFHAIEVAVQETMRASALAAGSSQAVARGIVALVLSGTPKGRVNP